jgi:predicted lipoprotein with Yx(FWY)xxD motif
LLRKRLPVIAVAAIAGAALAALTGLAIAKSFTLGVVKDGSVITNGSTTHEAIAVNSKGLAVYDLIPETTHHPLCTQANGCFSFWFPVKVASAHAKLSAAAGIKGKLATWHRDGFFQVTLGGHPLYTFKGDGSKKGTATGNRIANFNGTWHVIKASGGAGNGGGTTTSSTTSTTTTSTPCYYPPCY